MVEPRMSRWGVGPSTFVPSGMYAAAAWLATWMWPEVCRIDILPELAATAGLVLIGAGLLTWSVSVISVMKFYNEDRLVTSGLFAVVRHPVYAAWIVLIFPGLALMLHSWPVFIAPVLAYVIFRRLIRQEDDYLERRFGKEYLAWRSRVSELIPIPRLRKRLE